jgi:hypothetical protein
VAAQADLLGASGCPPKQVGTRQIVVEDDIGARERVATAQRQEAGITWPGADENHFSCNKFSHIASMVEARKGNEWR